MRLEITDHDEYRSQTARTLQSFDKVLPVYAARGFTKESALVAFAIFALIDFLGEFIDDEPEEGDEWKKGE